MKKWTVFFRAPCSYFVCVFCERGPRRGTAKAGAQAKKKNARGEAPLPMVDKEKFART